MWCPTRPPTSLGSHPPAAVCVRQLFTVTPCTEDLSSADWSCSIWEATQAPPGCSPSLMHDGYEGTRSGTLGSTGYKPASDLHSRMHAPPQGQTKARLCLGPQAWWALSLSCFTPFLPDVPEDHPLNKLWAPKSLFWTLLLRNPT